MTNNNIAAPTSVSEALRVCKQAFLSVGVFSGAANLLMLVPAFYMLNIYDKAVAHNSVSTLVMLSIISVLMFLGLFAMEVVRGWILVAISSRLDNLLSATLFERTFINAVNVGRDSASAQPLQDLTSLRQFITGTPIFALFDAPWLPIYLVILFLFHPALGWLGIFSAALLFAIALINQRRTKAALKEANALVARNQLETNKNLRNAEVAAAMGMTPELLSRWRQRQISALTVQADASRVGVFFNSLTKVLRLTVQSAAIGMGAYLVLLQEISPGMIIAGSILIGRALQPVELAVGAWKGFVDAKGQYDRLEEVMLKIPLPEKGMPLPDIDGSISISNAVIVPPGSNKASLQCAKLEIAAGETTMILGPSGAGKSSLVRGILGIWPVATGAIRIDGAAAQDYDRADIGTQIGYLPQDIEILDGTISANIARFGEVDPESVVAAARDAGVHDFILSLPRGYDTEIGSDGGLLSPGQKQRIALARAIYRYPKLIVLDEPNSNLDEAGEAALNNTIRIMQERRSTILVVSHRQGVLPLADNLILVSSAQVIDFGKRQEVLARVQATQRPQRDGRPAETVSTAEPKPTITKPTEGPKAIPKSPVVWTGAKKAKDHDDKSD